MRGRSGHVQQEKKNNQSEEHKVKMSCQKTRNTLLPVTHTSQRQPENKRNENEEKERVSGLCNLKITR
jgi:hypothetical protein